MDNNICNCNCFYFFQELYVDYYNKTHKNSSSNIIQKYSHSLRYSRWNIWTSTVTKRGGIMPFCKKHTITHGINCSVSKDVSLTMIHFIWLHNGIKMFREKNSYYKHFEYTNNEVRTTCKSIFYIKTIVWKYRLALSMDKSKDHDAYVSIYKNELTSDFHNAGISIYIYIYIYMPPP